MSTGVSVCYEVIRAHSKSFSLASRLLAPDVRDRAVAVYAWCRRADDAIDLAGPAGPQVALSVLRSELDEMYAGREVGEPVLRQFQRTVWERGIPRRYADDLLAGMAMDVAGQRYETLEPLLQYCYCVAGSVGLMMCHVMGVRDEGAMRNAAHLGMAMQLTNICRDVKEDWERGRLYIPDAVLASFGIPRLAGRLGEPFPPSARLPVARAIGCLLDEADRYYASGDEGLAALSWRSALAIRTARTVYASIGDRIRQVRCDPLAGRAFVPLSRKLVLLLSAAAAAGADIPLRLLRLQVGGACAPARLVRYPEDVLPV
ncbi:MAG: phytoene/squalene synthase family protein [Gemmatimonadota bacterium]|jgi:phytoene synthase|nr:MAG: phytoene/squalene synthase family protein [Gemmatimonadota bacterium]